MAPTLLFIVLAFAISGQVAQGNNVECDYLNEDSCTYAVSSTGRRCLLEKRMIGSGYTCRASEIMADKIKDWIETEECINACGVERRSLGISSDSLLDREFVGSLCSEKCYRSCPNIVDLYFNLAAGEGVYLPKFCESRKINNGGRRDMLESDGGEAASSPDGAPLGESAITEGDGGAWGPDAWAPAEGPDGTPLGESAIIDGANDASSPDDAWGPDAWAPDS